MKDLPHGWASAPLRSISIINPAPPDQLDDEHQVSFVPMASVEAESGRLDASESKVIRDVRGKSYRSFIEGDVLFAKVTPCMENGKIALASGLLNGVGFGSSEFHVVRAGRGIAARYLMHFLMQRRFRDDARRSMSGTAGLLRVSSRFLEEAEIPVPPTQEQERIVAAIEEQFSRLDAGVEALESARKKLKRMRSAVLQSAVFGRLVVHGGDPSGLEESRLTVKQPARRRAGRLWGSGTVPQLSEEERSSLPTHWQWAKVATLGVEPDDTVQVGPMSIRSADFAPTGVPVLNVGSVQWDYIDEAKLHYMPPDLAANFSRYRIEPGDVLFTRSGTVGRSAVASENQRDWLMTFHLLRVRPNPSACLPEWLRIVFEGAPHIRRQARGAAIGTTRAGFNTRLLAELDVPLPPLAEQMSLVNTVRSYLSELESLDIRMIQQRVTALRSSILAAAFSGRLVLQDSDDEPAPDLLDRIAAARVTADGRAQAAQRRPRSQRQKITA